MLYSLLVEGVCQDVKNVVTYLGYLVTILLSMGFVAYMLYGAVSLVTGAL